MALADNLIAYYKFQGNSSDSVGAVNGTDTGITYNTSHGIIGQGANFAGGNPATGSKITFGANSEFNLTAPYSISLWINPNTTASGYNNIIVNVNTGFSAGFALINYNGAFGLTLLRYLFGTNAATDLRTSGGLTNGTWYHVVVTDNGTSAIIYLQGASSGTVGSTANSFTSVTGFTLGDWTSDGAGTNYNGDMDELGVWTRALSSAEVTTLYNGGAGLTYPFGTATIHNLSTLGVGA